MSLFMVFDCGTIPREEEINVVSIEPPDPAAAVTIATTILLLLDE